MLEKKYYKEDLCNDDAGCKLYNPLLTQGQCEYYNKMCELLEEVAEKDKEIEELEESNGVTRALCKNYYTQLQNYKSKLYGIDIPKLRKKHLTPEEKLYATKEAAELKLQENQNVED